MEEGLIELTRPPVLHGVFFSRGVSTRDHVVVFVVRHYRQTRLPEPNREIIACGVFAASELPEDTTAGTRNRIAEVLKGQPVVPDWR